MPLLIFPGCQCHIYLLLSTNLHHVILLRLCSRRLRRAAITLWHHTRRRSTTRRGRPRCIPLLLRLS